MFQKRSTIRHLVGVLAAGFVSLFLMQPPLVAQTVTGSIIGTIRDSSGAVIAGASVAAKNKETGLERTATTDASGSFHIVSIPAGTYDLTSSAAGFQTTVRSGVTLTVGATLRVDFALSVGAVTQEVEVTAEAPQVDTTTSTMSGLVQENQIHELPLNGRDWLQLGALQVGVLTVGSRGSGSVTQGMGLSMSIGGGRPSHNAYHIDGLIVNDQTNFSPGNAMGANLGVDSIREFSILTNTYSAEYGRSAGGVINAITKSGTNSIHGSAFYFGRNAALDARNFFDRKLTPSDPRLPAFRRHQFGGSLGGPIKRDKLFYFGNYEGLRQFLSQTPPNTNTLSPNARNGIVCVGASAANCPTTQIQIAASVKPYLDLFPRPNGDVAGDTGKFLLPTGQTGRENFVTGKMDYLAGSNTTIAGGYTFDNTTLSAPDAFHEKLTGSRSRNQRVAVSLQHVFSAAVLDVARTGFTRTAAASSLDISPINPLVADRSLGFIPGGNAGTITVPGLTSFSGIGSAGTDIFWYTAPQFIDDLSWVRGRHSMKMGFSVESIRDNVSGLNNPGGNWQFGTLSDFLTATSNSSTLFNSELPSTDAYRGQRTKLFGMYFQDDIRLRSNLTVNAGVRYEPATAISEINGKASNLIPLTSPDVKIGNPLFGNPTLKTIAPRLGFAWDPTGSGKTSIRAAAGVYYPATTPNITNNRVIRAAPFYASGTVVNPGPGTFPNAAWPLETRDTLSTVYMEHNPPTPYTIHWDFNVQRQLNRNVSLTLGYVGSRAVHLPTQTNDTDQVPQFLTSISPDGHLEFPTTGTIQRVNPNFGKIQTQEWYGWSRYHALVASLTQRASHGLTFQGSYTWSRSIDIGAIEYSSSALPNAMDNPYAFKPELNRGPSDYDFPQHLSANFLWEVPTPGMKIVPVRFLLSGWEIGGIFTLQGGAPFNIRLANDQARTGNSEAGKSQAGQRPDYIGGSGCSPNATNPGVSDINNYINTQCFAFPALGALGNFGRNVLRGPGMENFDFSLYKNHNLLGEKLKAQFRVEMFNVFNRPNFQYRLITAFDKNGSLQKGNFVPSGTVTTARQVQFGMKFVF